MAVSAPGRFSITTGWPQSSLIFWAMTRERMSVGPPAGNGTTMRMVRLGKVGDCASDSVTPASASPSVPRALRPMRSQRLMTSLRSLHPQPDLLRQRRPVGILVSDELGHSCRIDIPAQERELGKVLLHPW